MLLARLFLTFVAIGSYSFGGYMSLIAMIRHRLVVRDRLIDDEVISEGTALAAMLPGPVAVNVVGFCGYKLAGVMGFLISLIAVLIPSFILVLVLSILFFQISFDESAIKTILLGVTPVIAAVIVVTGYEIARSNSKTTIQKLVFLMSLITSSFFQNIYIIYIILIGSIAVSFFFFKSADNNLKHQRLEQKSETHNLILFILVVGVGLYLFTYIFSDSELVTIFKEFASISVTLFGGGYVVIPMLKNVLIEKLNWVNNEEFIYGISIGQITPGPIMISSAFFGYKVSGIAGALVATLGIFLPTAIIMLIFSKIFSHFRNNVLVLHALSFVRPAVAGLILSSGLLILLSAFNVENIIVLLIIFVASSFVLIKFKIQPIFLIIAGVLFGYLLS